MPAHRAGGREPRSAPPPRRSKGSSRSLADPVTRPRAPRPVGHGSRAGTSGRRSSRPGRSRRCTRRRWPIPRHRDRPMPQRARAHRRLREPARRSVRVAWSRRHVRCHGVRGPRSSPGSSRRSRRRHRRRHMHGGPRRSRWDRRSGGEQTTARHRDRLRAPRARSPTRRRARRHRGSERTDRQPSPAAYRGSPVETWLSRGGVRRVRRRRRSPSPRGSRGSRRGR